MKITRDILASFLSCKYKASLKLNGAAGPLSDFEECQNEITVAVKRKAVERIVAKVNPADVLRNVAITPRVLKAGPAYLLDATLETKAVNLRLDGLKRVPFW